MLNKYSVIFLLFTVFYSTIGNAQTAIFTGAGGDNLYTNPSNWSPVSVPDVSINIVISSFTHLVVNGGCFCNDLTVMSNATYGFNTGCSLTVTGDIYNDIGEKRVDNSSRIVIKTSMSVKFEEPDRGTFIDIRDGKVYKWVRIPDIDNRIWMAENLNFAGASVSYFPNDDPANEAVYGRLYDWDTVMDGASMSSASPSGVRGLCPYGWHLPSQTEFYRLTKFAGDERGNRFKEAGTAHWPDPNPATNDYGFTALPAGERRETGTFQHFGTAAKFWTASTPYSSVYSICFYFYTLKWITESNDNNDRAMSIRCVKDY
jgi:uncharacterized protein (TIGR02145 family)